jgi:hypothetical protein
MSLLSKCAIDASAKDLYNALQATRLPSVQVSTKWGAANMMPDANSSKAVDTDRLAISREDHYKVLIEDARALGDRRETINDLFMGLVTLMLGAQGYLLVNSKDTDIHTTIYIACIGVFGAYLSRVWRSVLEGYRTLLNFRYHVLKQWERNWFAADQQYYVSEDALYDPKLVQNPPTPLVASYADHLQKIRPFVNIYKLMPRLTLFAFLAVACIRPVLLLIGILPALVPQIVH